jgi:hypothetical protein
VTTLEYQLARITAQSKNADPKAIKGGLSELTPDDIRAAVSMVNQPVTYHVLMAKYCGSDLSESALLEIMEDMSMRRFMRDHSTVRINGQIHRRLVESAILHFMAPANQSRSQTGNAQHCGVDIKTWNSHYKQHFHLLTRFLVERESDGIRLAKKRLKTYSP